MALVRFFAPVWRQAVFLVLPMLRLLYNPDSRTSDTP